MIERLAESEKTFVDARGEKHHYLVFVPYDYNAGEKRPLLLFLNGMGENGTDGVSSVSNNFGIAVWEMKRTFPFITAIPQCRPTRTWAGEELERALAIMSRVAADYGTDPDRVYVTGVSSGGDGVWNAISAYQKRFAAAVPVCGGGVVDARALAKAQLPIWNFYNSGDQERLVMGNRHLRQAMLKAGASPLVTEYQQIGHNAWDLAYRSSGMYEWLLEQSRSKNAHRTKPYAVVSPEEMLASWIPRGSAKWNVGHDGSVDCDNQLGYLMSPVAYRTCEFDIDVHIDSLAEGCQLGLFTAALDDAAPEYTLHLTFADAGSGGLSHGANGWIAKLDAAAQRQLDPKQWNDVRLHFSEGRITARINGWKAVDVAVSHAQRSFHVALIASESASQIRWRNPRLYSPD